MHGKKNEAIHNKLPIVIYFDTHNWVMGRESEYRDVGSEYEERGKYSIMTGDLVKFGYCCGEEESVTLHHISEQQVLV